MAKKIKEHKEVILFSVIGLILVMVGAVAMFEMMAEPEPAAAATASSTVSVSATVNEFITISLSTSSVNLTPDLLDTSGNLNVASSTVVTVTCGTNDPDGYDLSIKGVNAGLASGTVLIATVSATGTAATGTDAYGVNASSSAATVQANYAYWGTNDIGEIASSTDNNIAVEAAAGTGKQTDIKIYASCDASQAPGTYTDTITLTVTGKT